ncbi:MAG TPA: condensation domain-containing protein, partial [Ktedonobacteraceae bacterium]|nr:condensation domain-containing protein [Ktedonobacteraceae bacterium]
YATWYEIQALEEQAVTIPIGQPLANTELYILNDWMQPVPEGIPGELYIGGDGLAHGYLDRPEPTAERFVPHPFSNRAGARLYRTGDIVKWRDDGNVVFIGRRDHQIKLRGHRIELGEIETALLEHPAVQESVALLREDTPGDQHLAVYVVPTRDQQEMVKAASSWAEEQIESWHEIYEDMYRSAGAQEDPTFNIFGWNSTYTGLPIPPEEMREQIDQAVERILERGPERVMEIGFGSGLLLFRVAPHCQEYVASDFSREALDYVQQVLATHPCPQVTLAQQHALESLQVPAESFDAIILNSVLQYFPDIEYVVRVLMDAVAALKPGGFLFLGDVRNLALQKAYSTSVELYRARASLTREALRQAVLQRLGEEQELLIDPAFFLALQREWPQIGQVQVLLKRGRTHNELTQFRYDAVLRKAVTEEMEQERIVWDWRQGDVTLDRIERFLQAGAPEALQIEQVPNTRLEKELQQVLWVFGEQGPATVKELCEELERQEAVHRPTPEDFWAAGERLGYRVTINWSAEGDGSHYDVLFSQAKEIQVREYNALPLQKRGAVQRWFKYANNPLQGKMARTLIPQLRSFLKTQLAEYALPSHYVILESLPLTPNGKVDRRALPIPDRGLPATRETFVAPHTEQQERLATIWIELLHVSQISIHDNFFELGGHSLLATQVISRLRNTFQIDLPLRSLFEHPTIAQLARIIEQQQQMGLSLQRPALVAQARPAVLPLSFAQERLWFLDQLEPLSSRYNMPAALRFNGFLSIMALEKSVKHIVQRHEVLRTTFAFSTGRPVQVIAPELALPLPVFDLSGLSTDECEGELRHLLAQEANRPFDLERGPLLRVAVMHLGVREHVFLFNQHHIVSDGWSLSILAQELRTFYQAYRTGQAPELAALRLQYA